MKNTTPLPGRQQSGSRIPAQPSPAAPPKPAPGPDPSKTVEPTPSTLHHVFVVRLAEIYAGKYLPEFEPLNDKGEDMFGLQKLITTVADPTARALYSLAGQLQEEKLHLRLPRSKAEVEQFNVKASILVNQIKIAMDLFWQQVHAMNPTCYKAGRLLEVSCEWKVFGTDSPENLVTSVRNLRTGSPGEFLASLLADIGELPKEGEGHHDPANRGGTGD